MERGESDRAGRLEAILEEYGALLRRTIAASGAGRLGISVDDVEQEARIRVWKALESEKTIADPASYLYRVAVSATIDAVRRVRARREGHSIDPREGGGAGGYPAPADGSPSPEDRASAREIATAIRRASGRLSKDRRAAVLLLLQGWNAREIAQLLGWSEGRARNLAYRGLEDLRRALEAEGIRRGD